ncbi:YhcN/YlaJ family sporulation lipoprotein [Brevibacillus sp. NRS-1366]|uniref:YhcN/YlaJ family sporulation lipoprotein n=1 Tax=Brevibacillus sp. NRS-1366 TaxID=3233899 RepID=UPI003D261097
MKKTWLYPAIAGIALLASACANNAAPNYTHPNKATTNQAAPRVTNIDGLHIRNYDGVRRTDVDGIHTRSYDGMRPAGVDGIHTRSYDGMRPAGVDGMHTRNFDGLHVRNGIGMNKAPGATDGMYPKTNTNVNNYNAYTSGVRPYHAFPDGTGNAGTLSTAPGTQTRTHSIYQNNAWNRGGAGVMQTGMPRMGYVQTDRQHVHTANASHVYVDRNALAQAVGNVTASCPGVQRSTVLVTDEEIFVGLNTNGADARTAKHQAKMNAMSVSPRYYKVYVTDNQNDIQEIARVASRSTNVHTARTEDTTSINTLIKRMGGTTDSEQVRTKAHGATPSKTMTKANMGTTSR